MRRSVDTPQAADAGISPQRALPLLVALALAALTFAAFAPVLDNDFVTFDDDAYILNNPRVSGGLTMSGIRWAFSTPYYGIYHPLAWISHMADCEFFGLDARGHHLHSLLIHIAAVLLLFHVLRRATGSLWRSALVALLFGIHPLQVQSVAWAAERKNVLSGFFWMASLWTYVRFAGNPTRGRYAALIAALTLGLLSKTFLVTVPAALLLLDFWPLARARIAFGPGGSPDARQTWRAFAPRIWEKIPLFLLSAAASVATVLSARYSVNANVLVPFDVLPLDMRLGNAVVSYVSYVAKLLWPVNLTFLYPYPFGGRPLWAVAGAAILLGAAVALAIRRAARSPYLLFGLTWFGITLLPNIGIVQYGWHALADRYAYIPMIGICVIFSWGAAEVTAGRPRRRAALLALLAATIPLLVVLTRAQTATWRNDEAFFRHGIEVQPDTWTGHYAQMYLGKHLYRQGRVEEAKKHIKASLREVKLPESYNNYAAVLQREGDLRGAITWYRKALRLKPNFVRAWFNLGLAHQQAGKYEDAVECYLLAIKYGPAGTPMTEDAVVRSERVDDDAYNNLGVIRFIQGRSEEAIPYYRAALDHNPRHANAHYNLGRALEETGAVEEARAHYREALRLEPGHEKALERMRKMNDG